MEYPHMECCSVGEVCQYVINDEGISTDYLSLTFK